MIRASGSHATSHFQTYHKGIVAKNKATGLIDSKRQGVNTLNSFVNYGSDMVKAAVAYTIKKYFPFSEWDDPDFKKFLFNHNPKAETISSARMRAFVEKTATFSRSVMKDILNGRMVSIAYDKWTDVANISQTGITVHFTQDFVLHKLVLYIGPTDALDSKAMTQFESLTIVCSFDCSAFVFCFLSNI